MDYPHTIRLRGLWEFEVLDDQSPAGLPQQALRGVMRVPGDWGDLLGCGFRGRVRYRRAFNWPSQLELHERVWLVIEGVDAHGEATLNDQPLGSIDGYAPPARFEITRQLAKRNELWLDIACPQVGLQEAARLRPGREYMEGGPIGEVRLEVCSTARIDSLVLYVDPGETPQLHVAGNVTGEGDELTLVVHAAERELACQAVTAGQPFQLVAPALALPQWLTECDEVQLALVECRLLARGICIWVEKRRLALPAPMPAGIFLVEGQETSSMLVKMRPIHSGLANRQTVREVLVLPPWLKTREILEDDTYDHFDLRGIRLVQGIRREWLDRLAPRLAHHPSIALWAVLDAAEDAIQPSAYGRKCNPAAKWGLNEP